MAELYLVEFKGSRRAYFYNTYYHNLKATDHVIVQAERGEDVGVLRTRVDAEIDLEGQDKPRSILRRASEEDLAGMNAIREQEIRYKGEVTEMIASHRLAMKVVDVECQFDGNKMTVFFTADHRIDFRDLVKDLASRYRTRIELRQIGVRDEARRLDGLGICGYRQCCNSFITEFAPVSTQQAREQNLPLNPAKISGNCGRLLCCLRYEVGTYISCRKKFPPVGERVQTSVGDGIIDRIDIFTEEAIIRTDEVTFVRCPLKEFQPDPEPPAVEPDAMIAIDEETEVEAASDGEGPMPADDPPERAMETEPEEAAEDSAPPDSNTTADSKTDQAAPDHPADQAAPSPDDRSQNQSSNNRPPRRRRPRRRRPRRSNGPNNSRQQ